MVARVQATLTHLTIQFTDTCKVSYYTCLLVGITTTLVGFLVSSLEA